MSAHRIKGYLRNERGAAFLVIVIMTVMVILTVVVAASVASSGQSRETADIIQGNQAFYMAESGLNACMYQLETNPAAIPESVFGQGAASMDSSALGDDVSRQGYYVWVETDSADPTIKHVTAKGVSGTETYVLKATLKQSADNPFYNPEGTGSISPDPNDPTIVGPDLTNEGWIRLVNSKTYWLNGGEHLFEGIDMTNSCRIRLTEDTTIWLRQTIRMVNSCTINVETDGHKLVIFMPNAVTGKGINLVNNCLINAFIYAPEYSVHLTNNCSINGLLVCDNVDAVNNCHYDPSGEDIPWPAGTKIKFEVVEYGR